MQNQDFRIAPANPVYHGSQNISYLGSKIWRMVAKKNKRMQSFQQFEKEFKKWVTQNSPRRLSRQYINGVAFFPR